MPTPLESMRLVAAALQPLDVPFAFVGGCAVWLLVDKPEFTDVRPTDDVDIIIEIVTLVEYYGFEDRLRAAGCQNDMSEGAPICRWIIKGCRVDIMPIDSKALGMSSKWFREALGSATIEDLGDGQTARVITAPLFVATKLAAFEDRGRMDVYCSHDLEDIVTVVDGREDNPKRIDLTVRPTSKLTPVRRPSPSLALPRRRATQCRARRRCEPSGGSASWPGGRRCNQAGDRSQSRRR